MYPSLRPQEEIRVRRYSYKTESVLFAVIVYFYIVSNFVLYVINYCIYIIIK